MSSVDEKSLLFHINQCFTVFITVFLHKQRFTHENLQKTRYCQNAAFANKYLDDLKTSLICDVAKSLYPASIPRKNVQISHNISNLILKNYLNSCYNKGFYYRINYCNFKPELNRNIYLNWQYGKLYFPSGFDVLVLNLNTTRFQLI